MEALPSFFKCQQPEGGQGEQKVEKPHLVHTASSRADGTAPPKCQAGRDSQPFSATERGMRLLEND